MVNRSLTVDAANYSLTTCGAAVLGRAERNDRGKSSYATRGY